MTRPFFTSETRRLGSIRDAVPLQAAIPRGATDLLLSAGRRTVRPRLAETFDPEQICQIGRSEQATTGGILCHASSRKLVILAYALS